MDRIINMVINTIIRQFTRKGINYAMKSGGDALSRRRARRAANGDPRVNGVGAQGSGPPREQPRQRHPDERRGDEILYPTDPITDDMQPRK